MRSTVVILIVGLVAALAQAETYYLDAGAAGPAFDGTKDNPWKTVLQMQTFLAAREGSGSGDTLLIASGQYGELIDGAHANDKVSAEVQRKIMPRTDWLVLKAADPKQPPQFSYVHVYGNRDAHLELNGLKVHAEPPYTHGAVVSIAVARKVRIINCDISATAVETAIPSGIVCGRGAKDIHIEGCTVYHANVGMSVGADKLVVRNNEVHHCESSGIQTHDGSATLLEGNYVHHQFPRLIRINLFGEIAGSFKKGDVIKQQDTGARATVYLVEKDHLEVTPDNKAKIMFAEGKPVAAVNGDGRLGPVSRITVADRTHGSGLSIRSLDLTARGNIIHHYGSSAGIFVYPVGKPYRKLLFENNLVFDSITRTVVLNEIGEDVVVRNNTFDGHVHAYLHKDFDGSGFHFYNNIAGGITVWNADHLASFKEGRNLLQSLQVRNPYTSPAVISAESTSAVYGNSPDGRKRFEDLFVNFAERDFRLKDNSQAACFADPSQATATDLNGLKRDDKPSAGCFEPGTKDWRTQKYDRSEGYEKPVAPK